ncbi:phage tail protein [Pseudoalteromonas ruthenica]|uniref:phage tail protein n=1 Tax=Pseudoalteromonas ruthenica TaxID=151081 RepID=UPI001244F5F0|nr:phage tail protein [Pseudoalteromonas ruthenica]|tara:strand:+ start:76129 stop:76650 length:522 start_codon:yes stop_codon:yes gene_type:complete
MSNTSTKLPVWFRGEQAQQLERAAKAYWHEIETALTGWLTQIDETHAAEEILDLLAWERDINRLEGEPLALYAKRIKYAVANAEDAGFNTGMERIFKRLGFGFVEINDRLPGYDWDMVEIAMLESEQVTNQALIKEIIRSYGMTCRRYFLKALTAIESAYGCALIEFEKEVVG